MTPNNRQLTDEQLAAAVEALRQRSTPPRLDAMRQAAQAMGLDPDRLDSLKTDEGDNNGNESR